MKCYIYVLKRKMFFLRKFNRLWLLFFSYFFFNGPIYSQNSVLSKGDWHKISIDKDGIYDLAPLLIDQFGKGIDFKTIQLFGNGKGILSELVSKADESLLSEIPLFEIDFNQNGQLDDQDQILFFASGPNSWNHDSVSNKFSHQFNIYRDENFYFFTIGQSIGKRINSYSGGEQLNPSKKIEKHICTIFHEKDETNIAKSGRQWVGDEMRKNQTKTFNLTINHLVKEDPILFNGEFWVRSTNESLLNLNINGEQILEKNVGRINGEKDNLQAIVLKESFPFLSTKNEVDVQINFQSSNIAAKAWVDYFELIASRKNVLENTQNIYLFPVENRNETYQFSFVNESSRPVFLWDITDFFEPRIQAFQNGSFTFNKRNIKGLKKYISFTKAYEPSYVGKIENQNILNLSAATYLMIYHPEFKTETEKLAEFHRDYYGYEVHCVDIYKIYNEFSSGGQDITGLRNFIKFYFDRGNQEGTPLKYVLLMGDASYDFKNRLEGNTNFVPSFQSYNSLEPTISYASDDFYAILEDDEGYWGVGNKKESLDIGIGRLPVKNKEEANNIVNKIIHYHQNKSFGDWRNTTLFLGDDEDQNAFFNDAENFSKIVHENHPELNVKKIYLDAYPQISFGSGNKYPEVNEAINKAIEQGTLVFNYIGHGGGSGMAHERVITRSQINAWNNYNKLPLFITATCELSQFDDPAQVSPGELMLLNPQGGAIGLITTSRIVFLSENRNLNEKIYVDNIFSMKEKSMPTLGDVIKKTKNESSRVLNQRNFTLLGDPGMRLAYPKEKVFITHINNQRTEDFRDTIGALGKVSISGLVADQDSNLISNFEGTLEATIFDKPQQFKTLGNDKGSRIASFSLQNNKLYSGRSEIKNGRFEFSFIVPKDIAYQFGKGKISFYASNENTDAKGFDNEIVVGGSSQQTIFDTTGPKIHLYLNDSSWVDGGLTHAHPILLANIFDFNGINTIGSGIGKDIVAVLDKNTDNERLFILNDYYRSDINSYQSGKIQFALGEIDKGEHTLHLKVWDVVNNSYEAKTTFRVGKKESIELANVRNYPNPFGINTKIEFEHNLAGEWMEIQCQVFSITGEQVFNTTKIFAEAPAKVISILWDGSEANKALENGTYFCRLTVKDRENQFVQKTLKLIILR